MGNTFIKLFYLVMLLLSLISYQAKGDYSHPNKPTGHRIEDQHLFAQQLHQLLFSDPPLFTGAEDFFHSLSDNFLEPHDYRGLPQHLWSQPNPHDFVPALRSKTNANELTVAIFKYFLRIPHIQQKTAAGHQHLVATWPELVEREFASSGYFTYKGLLLTLYPVLLQHFHGFITSTNNSSSNDHFKIEA